MGHSSVSSSTYSCLLHLFRLACTAERPPAPQPDGLTVTMRPYQLQSLAFMLEMEALVEPPRSGSGTVTGSDAGGGAAAGTGPGPSTSNTAGAGGSAPELDAAADPDRGDPGGYRRLFWVPITAASGHRFCGLLRG